MNNMPWMHLLVCPRCYHSFRWEPKKHSANEETGALCCTSCHMRFPVKNKIPRLLLPAQDTAVKQIQKVFAFKWNKLPSWGIKGGSASFMDEWILRKYGWKNPRDHRKSMARHRIILDAGCGLGRETLRIAQANPRATVIGLELSSCIDVAQQHAHEQGLKNIYFVQADLLHPPFRSNTFDFILSEGVMHHTPSTQEAFLRLSRLLKPGGEFAFYVYQKKAPLREYADDYVRSLLQNMPLAQAWALMEQLTQLGRSLARTKAMIRVPADITVLGLQKGRYPLQRWIYENMFKCFWNDALPFQDNVLINFDWYLPRFAWRHTVGEIARWVRRSRMKLIHVHSENAGVTVRAVKNKGARP